MSSAAAFVTTTENDQQQHLHLLVEGMHCPSCVALIENAMKAQPDVRYARLNLSTRRLQLAWEGTKERADELVQIIRQMGYRATAFDPTTAQTQDQQEEKFLLRCLAVAGFASGNLMLFSVALWASDVETMGIATRSLFHWVQALIAIPAIAYTGLPFYRSAWKALKSGHTNMDVPISVAVILATLMSVWEAWNHGEHAYFDSAVMLIFFLLIGRYLEARAKGKARGAAQDLLAMMTGTATVLREDGTQAEVALSELTEGMVVQVAMGEKIGADGVVLSGTSELDTSLITGETLPRAVSVGDAVFAGTLNLSAPLSLRVTKASEQSLIAEIVKLMEVAEQSQSRYVTLADRISGWYTPVVHLLAAATFIGWWGFGGAHWQVALLYAATVLIITCPCALGLAVPVVQVLASGKLMRQGILLKSGSALERLSGITRIIFDKTGTLTLGHPSLLAQGDTQKSLQLAASLAVHSKHPLSQAVAAAYVGELLPLDAVEEIPGYGLQAFAQGKNIRLGKAEWCGAPTHEAAGAELWLAIEGEAPVRFAFEDALRTDADAVIAAFGRAGIPSQLLSGDRAVTVQAVAEQLGRTQAQGGLTPLEKTRVIESLKQQGEQVLMVGDGLNDAPSLAAANVSMSPASAIHITQNAADIVFQGEQLAPVYRAWQTARFAQTLVRQNFWLATGYNLIAIPLAVAGYVTPLVAAVAMSSSSLVVIANALRLNLVKDSKIS